MCVCVFVCVCVCVCVSEEDPDYDFLHTDLSSSDNLPPLPHPSSLPPALPEKRRRSAAGEDTPVNLSVYLSVCLSTSLLDCLIWAGVINSEASTSFGFEPDPQDDSPAHSDDVTSPDEPTLSPLSPSKTPPPLPEKKRHSE